MFRESSSPGNGGCSVLSGNGTEAPSPRLRLRRLRIHPLTKLLSMFFLTADCLAAFQLLASASHHFLVTAVSLLSHQSAPVTPATRSPSQCGDRNCGLHMPHPRTLRRLAGRSKSECRSNHGLRLKEGWLRGPEERCGSSVAEVTFTSLPASDRDRDAPRPPRALVASPRSRSHSPPPTPHSTPSMLPSRPPPSLHHHHHFLLPNLLLHFPFLAIHTTKPLLPASFSSFSSPSLSSSSSSSSSSPATHSDPVLQSSSGRLPPSSAPLVIQVDSPLQPPPATPSSLAFRLPRPTNTLLPDHPGASSPPVSAAPPPRSAPTSPHHFLLVLTLSGHPSELHASSARVVSVTRLLRTLNPLFNLI